MLVVPEADPPEADPPPPDLLLEHAEIRAPGSNASEATPAPTLSTERRLTPADGMDEADGLFMDVSLLAVLRRTMFSSVEQFPT